MRCYVAEISLDITLKSHSMFGWRGWVPLKVEIYSQMAISYTDNDDNGNDGSILFYRILLSTLNHVRISILYLSVFKNIFFILTDIEDTLILFKLHTLGGVFNLSI